jgi:hypothetical protein
MGVKCNGGLCPAHTIAQNASAIACTSEHVYFASNTGTPLNQVSRDGTGATPYPTVISITTPFKIAAANGYVVWTDSSTPVHAYAMLDMDLSSGTPPAAVPVGTSGTRIIQPFTTTVATDGVNVYWVDFTSAWQAPITGGAAIRLYNDTAMSPIGLTGLAIGSRPFGTRELFIADYDHGGIKHLTVPVAAPPMGVSNGGTNGGGHAVQTNSTSAVWFTEDNQGYIIHRMSLAAFIEDLTPIKPNFIPSGLAADDKFVYATDFTNGQVLRWSLADPPVKSIWVPNAPNAHDVCVCGRDLYWLSGTDLVRGDAGPPG